MMERAAKRRRVSPPFASAINATAASTLDADTRHIPDSDFAKNASNWNLEQDYEQRPRKQKKELQSTRLPIKTAEGRIEQYQVPRIEGEILDGSSDDLGSDTPDTDVSDEEAESEQSRVPLRQQILEAKEELARIAAQINEDPEENSGSMKRLAEITSSRVPTITKLGLATQLAVFKDVIPGYRIRPVPEDAMKEKLSKEVRKLRNFEQSIVKGYQRYVKELSRVAALRKTDSSEETASLSTVAVSCACNLVTSVPHFNFRSELLKIIVGKLATRGFQTDFNACCEALSKLFQEDDEGNASLEAVAMLAKMIKGKNYRIDEQVLNLFLDLRLLSELSSKASTNKVDKPDEAPMGKKQKQKREFRTKKMRKHMKEQRGIEKEMQEADAVVGHEQRDKIQSETLKLVFSVYFRILKARTPHLMGPVLEGLVKYAHLINQDFFGDLLESLKDLIRDSEILANADAEDDEADAADVDDATVRNNTRESLLCVITAFALLQGQDAAKVAESLHLDLSFFITHLYRTLYPAALNCDLELSSKSTHLPDPHSSASTPQLRTKVNVQTTIVLLLRSLHAVLLPSNTRAIPPVRLAAFSKQLLTSSMHMPEKSCTAMLGLMCQVAKIHQRRIGQLWRTEERKGDGVFDPLSGEVESSNPFATSIWEGELLRWHYAPSVREGVKNLEGLVVGTTA